MIQNPVSLSETQKSTTNPSKNCTSNLFDYINSIKTDEKSNLIALQNLHISYSQAQFLSGFKPSSFSSTELFYDFYNKIHQIESINILHTDPNSYILIRIMILISLLFINDDGKNERKLNLKLHKINNEEIKQDEIELANQIRNMDKAVDLINEGWNMNCIHYVKNTKNIESIEFSKGPEKVTIIAKFANSKTFSSHQPLQNFLKISSPSSSHSSQHSITRKKRQSTRQFDRTDYSNESSNYNEDYDYYTDDDDELLKDPFLENENESRLSLSRRINSEPFIDINPMLIFDDDRNKDNFIKNNTDPIQKSNCLIKNEKFEYQSRINEYDDADTDMQLERKKTNVTDSKYDMNIWKNRPKRVRNTKYNNENDHYGYSYSSNSSDFDDNYYSSGDEEATSSSSNDTSIRNFSNERRRHSHHHNHHISKRIKNKIELRKLEDSPRRTTQLYIDEFDDVRKLQASHKQQQQQNFPTNSTPDCKNNNKRDLEFYYENDFNNSDDSDDNEVPTTPNVCSIKPSSSSPSNIKLPFQYELIDFEENKQNFNEIDLNDQDLEDEDDGQITFEIKLDIKLNSKNKKNPILLNFQNENEEEDEDIEEEEINNNNNNIISYNNYNNAIHNNSIPDDLNDFFYENSSSDSNEEFDDLDFEQQKNEETKTNNNNNSRFENRKNFSFGQSDEFDDDEKKLQSISDDIYCSEPFPVGAGNQNDSSLLSPNHRKMQRNSKKRQINNA